VPGRTPAEAVQNFLDPVQKALSCVCHAVVNVHGGYHPSTQPHVLTLGDGSPAPLAGNTPLGLSVIQQYRVIQGTSARAPWTVVTVSYYYALEDANSRELFAFHWHPAGPSTITFPHLHLGAGVAREQFTTFHIPTGRITLDKVLRFAITELGVRPLRQDWSAILASFDPGPGAG